MNKRLLLGLLCCLYLSHARSAEPLLCTTSKPKEKPYGTVSRTECTMDGVAFRDSIKLNGVDVLSDTQLYPNDSNQTGSIRIYTSGASNTQTGCAPKLYLLDMSMQPIKVLAFGVKKACNEFHWASWGNKRSVIALKHNVQFVYENGKLTPPPRGEKLWKAIEPPHAGSGLAQEDAIAFVEDVPLPSKQQ